MSDKTEDPTPKRMREAKKKGQIAKSQDVTTAFLFMTAFSMLIATGGTMKENLKMLMKDYFEYAVNPDLVAAAYNALGVNVIFRILLIVMPIFAANFVIAAFISFVQVGSLFTFDPLMPKLDKLNPMNKIKQWFSPQTFVELLKSSVKLTIILLMACLIVGGLMGELVKTVGKPLSIIDYFLGDMVKSFTVRVAAVFFLIAAGDYFFQKKMHMKNMKMSKDEVKREYKEDEGDPMMKHKRKQLMHELVFNNQMKNMKKANVVVVNPTKIAVAIFYDREKGGAPEIIAKGERLIADKIREVAKEYGIPIMRNVSLAQALNKVDVGDQIPEDLFEAVAEILNFVYKMGQQGKR